MKNDFDVPEKIIECLTFLLNTFSGTPDKILLGVGLPQGPMPSHFLAHLMLHKFDLEIIDCGFSSYFRYVDDIHLYSDNENDLEISKLGKTQNLIIDW